LEWQRDPSTALFSWNDAIEYCLELCDHGGGWRLASVKELGSILEADEDRGVVAPLSRPLAVHGTAFWSSTPDTASGNAFLVDFQPSGAFCYPIRTPKSDPVASCVDGNTHRAWCVRTYTPDAR
jgi:hypothetical protein